MNNLNAAALAALKKYPEARRYLDEPLPDCNDEVANGRYVYEWFTKDDGKVFYIGRGVRLRYKHILWDAKKSTAKGRQYRKLQEEHGIDYRFVYEGLSYHESKILAYALIRQRIDEGANLIQSLDQWLG